MAGERTLILTMLPPSAKQRRIAIAVGAALLLAFFIVLPFRDRQWPPSEAFNPIVDSILFINDLITAALLYGQYSIGRQRSTLALAMGYLYSALIVVPHLLTHLGDLGPPGLRGYQAHVWLYIYWRLGLPLAVIAYASLRSEHTPARNEKPVESTMLASIAFVAGLVVVLVWVITAKDGSLLPIWFDPRHLSQTWTSVVAPAILLVNAVAIATLWRRRFSVLDIWLLVALWAWYIEILLLDTITSRYSVAWYAAAAFGVMASCVVLLVLLYESTTLYARLAAAAEARDREAERRRLTLQVVAGSIAHDLNQPLAAICRSSDVAVESLQDNPPNLQEVRAALDDIAAGSRRASGIIKSIGATLTGQAQSMAFLDIGHLVVETLTLLQTELQTHQVTAEWEPSQNPHQVKGNKAQLQEVLVNLITNAIESMDSVTDRPRALHIRCASRMPSEVSITVEDSGAGIESRHAVQIFDPFFSTKAGGTGLGLAICRSIVEAHGGKISASGGKEHGSIFQIRLPAV